MVEHRTFHFFTSAPNFVGSLPQTPNDFGAQNFRHQPLAEAGGMRSFETLSHLRSQMFS